MQEENKKLKLLNKQASFFRYQKVGEKYLLTNIIGEYVFLTPKEFDEFIKGTLSRRSKTYQLLKNKHFLKNSVESLAETIIKYRQKHQFLYEGPSLHIIVVTLNCNYRCVYCQASSRYYKEKDAKNFDLDKDTAQKIVDTIFESPSKSITIEFQGGEPLINWPIIKFIIEYAEKLNKKYHKDLLFTMVSNLSLMTDTIFKYCRKHRVALATSLDGPEYLHNLNRPSPDVNSYKATTKWIQKIKTDEKKHPKDVYYLNALLTVSRNSLKYPKEIINEYLKLGFTGIHLRPLSQLGFSHGNFNIIGYSEKEFFDFWKKSVDYILELNKKKIFFYERGIVIILKKLWMSNDPNFMDLRSPCGAGIGQILYNYDGKVYTCDEGRMLGNDIFLLGNVKKDSYQELISSPKLRMVCQASILENTQCDKCVYEPYCGICPVLNYALYGNIFAPQINTFWCQLHKDMFNYVFAKLQDPKIEQIFKSWVGLIPIKNKKYLQK
ncbi:MAG: His-Xaa-Ser system radical SAM maturase HxsB [Minisyncoccia bacterium]